MANYLPIIKIAQLVIVVLLVIFVLVQSKGKGLSSEVGNVFSVYGSRRGVEKIIFFATILFAGLFILNSLLIVFLS